MNKYNIEGGINFFEELYKSLDVEESNEKTDDDNNKCLITNLPLVERFIEIKCGHKFNYIPLYNDLVNHRKFNNMEGSNTRLNLDEIRCPYCRSKDKKLLPYYEELGLPKINGVNFYDPTIKSTSTPFYTTINITNYSHKCQYELHNENFDDSKPESETNNKFIPCGKSYASKINVYNSKNPSEPINYGDSKYYCWNHNKIMIKQYKLQIKNKEKEDKKLKKIQDKEEKQKAKEEEKQKIKEDKQKAKEEAKVNKKPKFTENVVLGPSIIENQTNGCVQLLKSGLKKGSVCGCKIIAENMCKRHYLLTHK
jgi:DNA-directed RNA polymerase subunit RPC12/RpoP